MAHLHSRMPVVLKPDVLARWMDPQTGKTAALELLQENRGAEFVYYPVTRAMGNVRSRGPGNIEEVHAV